MKVLLINPPITKLIYDTEAVGGTPPLGLAYLAAVLEEKENYEVKILDALTLGINNVTTHGEFNRTGLSEKDIRRYVENFEPNIVGITCPYTAHAGDMQDIARLVKEINSEIPVVVGGAHPSSLPNDVFKDKNIDIVVKEEGEITFLEIVKHLERKENIYNIDGTIIRKENKIFENPERQYIQDLNSIPFPARHLLPMHIYFDIQKKAYNYLMRNPATTMISSRGCPGHCIYCSIHSIWGNKWRGRSPKNVVDEIEFLVNEYGIKEIHFLDDNISLNRKRLSEICNEIIRRKIDIKWTTPNGIAIWTLDEELIEKMKESGCYRLTFGLESGNQETLKFIGKYYNYGRAHKLIAHANKIGLWTISTFIIGFPYESMDSIKDTINRAIDSGIDFPVFYIATPLPGTRMYDIFKEENLLHGTFASMFIGGCDTKYFSKEQLKSLQSKAYSNFIKARLVTFPIRILRKINSFEDLRYAVKVIEAGTRILLNTIKHGTISTTIFYEKRVLIK